MIHNAVHIIIKRRTCTTSNFTLKLKSADFHSSTGGQNMDIYKFVTLERRSSCLILVLITTTYTLLHANTYTVHWILFAM